MFSTPFDNVVALVEPLIQRYPFVDGNKRTGLLVRAALLYLVGYYFEASRDEMDEVALAEHKIEARQLSQWFQAHAKPRN